MGVGPKMKELRTKAGLTQKDLADELHVTYQAVSKWEKDDAEPSIDTLKDMCKIFNCSIEELFDMKKPEEKIEEEKVQVVERVVVQEQKPVLGVCDVCKKVINDVNDYHKVNITVEEGGSRSHNNVIHQYILCTKCNQEKQKLEREKAEKLLQEKKKNFKKIRIKSIVYPLIAAIILFAVAGLYFSLGDIGFGFCCIGAGIMAYTFIACMMLDNTFVSDLWLRVASWGAVSFPHIIFDFSFEGCAFLIGIKLLFWFIGFVIGLMAIILATLIAAPVSVVAYPFALIKNIRCEE